MLPPWFELSWLAQDVPLWALILALLTYPAMWSKRINRFITVLSERYT